MSGEVGMKNKLNSNNNNNNKANAVGYGGAPSTSAGLSTAAAGPSPTTDRSLNAGRRVVFTADLPRPNLPLPLRLLNEAILRWVLPLVPSVAR